jgi:hypothetical protein
VFVTWRCLVETNEHAPLPALQPDYRDRLVKLLGKLGSDNDAERAIAARLADERRARCGLTWHDLILPAPDPATMKPDRPRKRWKSRKAKPKAPSWLEKPELVADSMLATPWEREFAAKLVTWRGTPSERQIAVLNRVWEKCKSQAVA